MILSHEHRFIFIKTNKTAGTSIEIALSKFCGPDDVITPISPDDEALRRSLGYRGAQNYRVGFFRGAGHYLRFGQWPRFYNHMSAEAVRRLVGEHIWDGYFTFCFERNPWERAVSLFHWRTRNAEVADFDEFIRAGMLDRLKRKGSDLYTRDGEILVDRVCRYEQFDDELTALSEQIGLPERLEPPHAKGITRTRRPDPVIRPEHVEHIAHQFRFEIERFGYRFERQSASD
jgi:hypothetical protein